MSCVVNKAFKYGYGTYPIRNDGVETKKWTKTNRIWYYFGNSKVISSISALGYPEQWLDTPHLVNDPTIKTYINIILVYCTMFWLSQVFLKVDLKLFVGSVKSYLFVGNAHSKIDRQWLNRPMFKCSNIGIQTLAAQPQMFECYLKCLFILAADQWMSVVWIKSHSNIGHSNFRARSYSAPMFECRTAAVGHQGNSFSGCQGADEVVRLSDHLFVACNKSSIKEKIIFLSILGGWWIYHRFYMGSVFRVKVYDLQWPH